MNILITGAAGFIGFHTVKSLADESHNITGIDNINDYYDVNLKYARLRESGIDCLDVKENETIRSTKYPGYFFRKTDITDLEALTELFQKERFDMVIHLAAQAGVRYSLINPHCYVQSNIAGFVNLLECCRHNRIKHFVYASSSSVYGINNKVPFSEEDRTDHPVSLYAATKRSNELMAYTYSHLYRLPTTGLRFFTVYGPWGRPDMAPMLFAKAIDQGETIKVFNHGNAYRDFTYIDDIVEGIKRVMLHIPDEKTKEPYCGLFNIGNSHPEALPDFIGMLEKAMNKKAKLEMLPAQPGDVEMTYADTSQLEEAIGYKPSTKLETGIRRFIDWFGSTNYY